MKVCTECNLPCDVITLQWKERDEFWGAPCWRDCYEDVSECCEAEMTEVEETDEAIVDTTL